MREQIPRFQNQAQNKQSGGGRRDERRADEKRPEDRRRDDRKSDVRRSDDRRSEERRSERGSRTSRKRDNEREIKVSIVKVYWVNNGRGETLNIPSFSIHHQ